MFERTLIATTLMFGPFDGRKDVEAEIEPETPRLKVSGTESPWPPVTLNVVLVEAIALAPSVR
jgi:hypothetical protein